MKKLSILALSATLIAAPLAASANEAVKPLTTKSTQDSSSPAVLAASSGPGGIAAGLAILLFGAALSGGSGT